MSKRTILAADMFCGAGGTSTGLLHACQEMGFELDLVAINHWDIAIDTHKANHPYAQHYCTDIDNLNPRKLVPGGRLNLLVASPECTHHSNARGGRPMSDQSRSSAWHILRWAEYIYIENILIENVKEFRSWGPLGANNRPIKKLKGSLYQNFLDSLRALGYKVEDRILNAANYGDPTTRERLFIIARRGNRKIIWPKQTHAAPERIEKMKHRLFAEDQLQPWVPARDIIDWNLKGTSIFNRKKPLAKKTLERIYAGLKKFGGPNAEPFLIVLRQHMGAQSVNGPLPTLTAGGKHIGLVEPFVLGQQTNSAPRSTDLPIPTVCTAGKIALVTPESFILPHRMFDQGQPDSIDRPLRTLVGKNARQVRVCEPVAFMVDINHGKDLDGCQDKSAARRSQSIDEPLTTVTTKRGKAVIEPFMMNIDHQGTAGVPVRSIDRPVSTQTTKARTAIVDPCIVKFYGTATAQGVHEPLDTVTTKDRFALVTTEHGTFALDIRLRMLQPRELAGAHSMKDYKFSGNLEDQTKQIGNGVPTRVAKALCQALI